MSEDTMHVVPVNDLIEHESEGDDCVCGPQAKLVPTQNGDCWLIVHNSLDGRERYE